MERQASLEMGLASSLLVMAPVIALLCLFAALKYDRRSIDWTAMILLAVSTIITWVDIAASQSARVTGVHQIFLWFFLVGLNIAAMFKLYAFTFQNNGWIWKSVIAIAIAVGLLVFAFQIGA